MINSSYFGTMVRKVESVSHSTNINKENSKFHHNSQSNRKKEDKTSDGMSFKEILEKELSKNK